MKLYLQPYKEHRKPSLYATWVSVLVNTAPGLRDGLKNDLIGPLIGLDAFAILLSWWLRWRTSCTIHKVFSTFLKHAPTWTGVPRVNIMIMMTTSLLNVGLWWASTLKHTFNQIKTCTCGTQVSCTKSYYANIETSSLYNQWSYPKMSCPHHNRNNNSFTSQSCRKRSTVHIL
jgi:hypothetical protein